MVIHASPMSRVGVWRDIRSGATVGLVIATCFSVVATVMRMLLGARAFDRIGLSWGLLVLVYFGALGIGGGVYGALLPLRRHIAGAGLLGFMLVFPMYLSLSVLIGLALKLIPTVAVGLVIGALLSAFVGVPLGISLWMDDQKSANAEP